MNITSKAMSICLFVRPSVRYYVSLTYSVLDTTTSKYLSKISIRKNVFFNNYYYYLFYYYYHRSIKFKKYVP